MSTKSRTTISAFAPASGSNGSRIRLWMVSVGFAVAANACPANDAAPRMHEKLVDLPEAILIPMKVDGKPMANGGWILTFRNGFRGPDAADREIQVRRVTYDDHLEEQVTASVSWEIVRTRNNLCTGQATYPCPDRLRVLAVPEGFVAVPESIWVEEGTSTMIRIIPAGIG